MPYEGKSDNEPFVIRLLKEPEARAGKIYSILKRGSRIISRNHFLPTWDGTNHFHFICEECKGVADVLEVRLKLLRGTDQKFVLSFYFGCRVCGATGQRRIYLDRHPDACYRQQTFDNNRLYLYGEGDKPEKSIDLKSDTNNSETTST
jgi:hypothetical protein